MTKMTLEEVTPQPSYIESSGRWEWPLPEQAQFEGCCKSVVTASREWWEYTPSEARPHPMAEGVQLRDGKWYWAIPTIDAHLAKLAEGPSEEDVDVAIECAKANDNFPGLVGYRKTVMRAILANYHHRKFGDQKPIQ